MIIVRSRALSRRRFLRGTVAGGLGCAVGLPLLDAMLDRHGTALATGEPLPLRLGSWMFGNGCPPGGMRVAGSLSVNRTISSLSSGFPGTTPGSCEAPPRSAASRVSSRSPPFALSPP